MIITDSLCLEGIFKRTDEECIRRCYNPDMIHHELITTEEIANMSQREYMTLSKRLPNFFYQRGLGLIRFFQIGVHEHAATVLLAYHYDITYDEAFELSENKREDNDESLMYMYNSVDLWLRLGNRAFFSGVALGRVYAKRGTLNGDEVDMFEYDFGYTMEWID